MNSDPINPEKVTLSALGLENPPAHTARPDQRPAAREVQDAAALTWLALADHQPAPASIWLGIQSQITPALVPTPPRRGWQYSITYGGWAAAAALAICWWLQDAPPDRAPYTTIITRLNEQAYPPAAPKPPAPISGELSSQNDSSLRRELLQLRQHLADATRPPDVPGLHRPAIVELRAPDGSNVPASASDAALRLQQLLTRALQRDLILRGAGEGPDIVLERGWPTANWLPGESGQTIRHLSFPADRWEELGLWKSPDLFYDPATSLSWAPAPDGLGYLGSVTSPPPDPSVFTKPRPKAEILEPPASPKIHPKPSGYLVSNPGSADATLLLSDLPPVPEGSRQFVIASNANGEIQQYQIAGRGLHGLDSPVNLQNNSATLSTDSLTLSSLSFPGHFTSFQIVQSATDRSTPTVILTSGQP